jgi:hypothetical protein
MTAAQCLLWTTPDTTALEFVAIELRCEAHDQAIGSDCSRQDPVCGCAFAARCLVWVQRCARRPALAMIGDDGR